MRNAGSFKKSLLISLFIFLIASLIYFNKSSPKPSIIIFSIDTLRADHLSCYGYARKTSPNIDAFSKDAVLIENAISQAPLTSPEHMSIFTSLTPFVHQIVNQVSSSQENYNLADFDRLDPNIETLPSVLKKNGYFTIGLHGGGNVSGEFGFDKGFDAYNLWGDLSKLDERMENVRKAVAESKRKKVPLFLFLHHYICHDPYLNAPEEFGLHFVTDKNNGLPLRIKDICAKQNLDCGREFWNRINMEDPKQHEHVVSLYDGSVYYSDYIFGKLIEVLKREGLYRNSIIILVSDHGEEFFEHSDTLHWKLFIETLHVPLLIKFPKNKYGGKIIRAQVRTMDILPTLLGFLRIKMSNFIQGVSFLPLISQKGSYNPCVASYSLRDNKWSVRISKDGFVYSNQSSHGVRERLFNSANDPSEMNNLSDSYPLIMQKMRIISDMILEKDALVKEKFKFKKGKTAKKEEVLESLKSLGYIQ